MEEAKKGLLNGLSALFQHWVMKVAVQAAAVNGKSQRSPFSYKLRMQERIQQHLTSTDSLSLLPSFARHCAFTLLWINFLHKQQLPCSQVRRACCKTYYRSPFSWVDIIVCPCVPYMFSFGTEKMKLLSPVAMYKCRFMHFSISWSNAYNTSPKFSWAHSKILTRSFLS